MKNNRENAAFTAAVALLFGKAIASAVLAPTKTAIAIPATVCCAASFPAAARTQNSL